MSHQINIPTVKETVRDATRADRGKLQLMSSTSALYDMTISRGDRPPLIFPLVPVVTPRSNEGPTHN